MVECEGERERGGGGGGTKLGAKEKEAGLLKDLMCPIQT